MRTCTTIISVLLIASCSKFSDYGTCIDYGDPYYVEVISKELTKRDIDYNIPRPGEICHSREKWLEYDQAVAYINSFYFNVAFIFKRNKLAEKEANKLEKILDKKGKKYSTSKTKDGEIAIFIYSGSPKEEIENRKILKKFEAGYK